MPNNLLPTVLSARQVEMDLPAHFHLAQTIAPVIVLDANGQPIGALVGFPNAEFAEDWVLSNCPQLLPTLRRALDPGPPLPD